MTLEARLERHLSKHPVVDPSAYIATEATVIGDVRIGSHASIFPGCVLRGDINAIAIGSGTNVQDNTVVHLADDYGVMVGERVTIGHKAMIHACKIEDECLIGMCATLLDGVIIGKGSIVGAGALVTKNTHVPPGSLVVGMPAKVKRKVTEAELEQIRDMAKKYQVVAAAHKARFQKETDYTY